MTTDLRKSQVGRLGPYEVVDEFREWICWKYGDKIRDHCWENNISETDELVDDEDNSF